MKEDNMKQGWEIKKLGEVCTFCSGYTPKENEFKKCATIPVPYFKVSDMNHLENHKYLTYTTLYLENGCKTYPKHTIVFPKNGAAIATNKKRLLGQDSVIDLNTGGVIANDKIVFYEYLYLFLLNLDFRLFTRRGAVPTLDIAELKKQTIPVPPLPVQEQIVSELDLLSGIIEKKREQLKELDALTQSIFYDMFGDPITNEKGWEVKKLGEVCESVSYGTSNSSTENGEYKYLRMNNITYSGHIDITDIKYIDVSDDEYEKYVVRKGDILFNRTNSKDLVGKTALFNFEEEMIIAGYIIRVRVNQDSIIPTFVVKWLNTPLMKSYFKNICKGAVNQSNINSKELKNIPISIPPLPLQRQFASKIEAIERQKELIKQSISETETLFNARMQEHFG